MRAGIGTLVTVAAWEMRGAARSRWVLGAAVLYTGAAAALALFGLRSTGILGVGGVGMVVDGLVALGVLLPPLFGLLLGAGSIAGAREQGILATTVVQPISRSIITWGTFTGMTLAVWAAIGIGLGLVGVILAPVVTAADLGAIAVAALATLAAAAVGVALGLVISVLAAGRSQATGLAAATWFLVALGIDLLLAVVAPATLGPEGLLWVVLANPIEAVRLMAMAFIDIGTMGPFGSYLIDRFGDTGSVTILGMAVAAWVVVPVALATALFGRRDL